MVSIIEGWRKRLCIYFIPLWMDIKKKKKNCSHWNRLSIYLLSTTLSAMDWNLWQKEVFWHSLELKNCINITTLRKARQLAWIPLLMPLSFLSLHCPLESSDERKVSPKESVADCTYFCQWVYMHTVHTYPEGKEYEPRVHRSPCSS